MHDSEPWNMVEFDLYALLQEDAKLDAGEAQSDAGLDEVPGNVPDPPEKPLEIAHLDDRGFHEDADLDPPEDTHLDDRDLPNVPDPQEQPLDRDRIPPNCQFVCDDEVLRIKRIGNTHLFRIKGRIEGEPGQVMRDGEFLVWRYQPLCALQENCGACGRMTPKTRLQRTRPNTYHLSDIRGLTAQCTCERKKNGKCKPGRSLPCLLLKSQRPRAFLPSDPSAATYYLQTIFALPPDDIEQQINRWVDELETIRETKETGVTVEDLQDLYAQKYTLAGESRLKNHTKGQDVAEWCELAEGVEGVCCGDVVFIGMHAGKRMATKTKKNWTKTAGVVSRFPGVTLGTRTEGSVCVPVFLWGTVAVRVDETSLKKKGWLIPACLRDSEKVGLAMVDTQIEDNEKNFVLGAVHADEESEGDGGNEVVMVRTSSCDGSSYFGEARMFPFALAALRCSEMLWGTQNEFGIWTTVPEVPAEVEKARDELKTALRIPIPEPGDQTPALEGAAKMFNDDTFPFHVLKAASLLGKGQNDQTDIARKHLCKAAKRASMCRPQDDFALEGAALYCSAVASLCGGTSVWSVSSQWQMYQLGRWKDRTSGKNGKTSIESALVNLCRAEANSGGIDNCTIL